MLFNGCDPLGGRYKTVSRDTTIVHYIDSIRISDSVRFVEKEVSDYRDVELDDTLVIPEEDKERIGIENISKMGVRTYRGQQKKNGVTYWYEAETIGWLKDIQVGSTFYQIERQEVVTIKETLRKPNRGLYVNTAFHTESGIGAGLRYQWKKYAMGYNYFADGNQQITLGYKLF